MKLFLITASVLSVVFAAPESYGIPRGPTQPIRDGHHFGAQARGTTDEIERNRFSNKIDLQQRNPLRTTVNSDEDVSRESEISSFDNERNQNQVGLNRHGESVFNNKGLRGSVFADNQQRTNAGLHRDQIGLNTAEKNSGANDFFTGERQRYQIRSQQAFGDNNQEVADRLASGPRDHTVPVFNRGQFGNPSNEAKFPHFINHEDQSNVVPISEQRDVLHALKGDRRGLHSVAPGQQTGKYINNGESLAQSVSGTNLNRQRLRQGDSRDFRTSPGQTNHENENQLNFRGSHQNRSETTGRKLGNQGIREIQGPANRVQNFQDTANPCGQDEVVDFRGECVHQKITRNIFVYQKPETKEDITNEVREQALSYNILFIKTSNKDLLDRQNNEEKKTIVYVLNKESTEEERKELEKDKHEVYFVNYKDGENPLLPHGSRLQTELNLSENGGSSNRFQQISGNFNQTPFDSFSQNFDAPGSRPVPIQDIPYERSVERPGFENTNQAIFSQHDGFQKNGF